MPDENSEKIVRLLEEIRDLTKERNEKLGVLLATSQQRYDEALRRRKEMQERMLTQRRRFLWILAPMLLVAIGFITYLALWVIPISEDKEMERQMEQYRMMQSNYLAQPH